MYMNTLYIAMLETEYAANDLPRPFKKVVRPRQLSSGSDFLRHPSLHLLAQRTADLHGGTVPRRFIDRISDASDALSAAIKPAPGGFPKLPHGADSPQRFGRNVQAGA